jgi:hypothetical protein
LRSSQLARACYESSASITTGRPRTLRMGSTRTRATASNRPAAGYGTTIVIGPSDTFAPRNSRDGRQRRPQGAENFGGRVDEGVAPPHPSQTRMCSFPASGSSWESLARGGVDDTIRDSSGKKGREGGNPTSLRSRQYSYPLSFRGQVCETQSSLPCFPSTVLSTWHPSFLDRVPVSPVPRCHRYY